MESTAQRKSLLNKLRDNGKRDTLSKLREVTNLSGKSTENHFSPEFKELMDRLRDETDDPIRAIVSGEQIGNAVPPEDGISMRDLLKSARSNFNRREYMKSVSDLGRFHNKMSEVVRILSNFGSNVDKIHEKFLFEGLDEDSKKYLTDLKSRISASRRKQEMIKNADILDFFTNLVTERGRALSGWEKRYPRQTKKLKQDTINIINLSDRLLNITLSVLKELAKARAIRSPDRYIESSKKIIKAYETYNVSFKTYYIDNVKGFLEKQEFAAPLKSNEVQMEDNSSPSVSTPVIPNLDTTPQANPSDVEGPLPEETVTAPKTNPAPPPTQEVIGEKPKMTPEEMVEFEKKHGIVSASVQQERNLNFYKNLRKMGNDSPERISAYISRYAKLIQGYNPEMAIELFKITKSIK